jgi:signal transduction histidine kinase
LKAIGAVSGLASLDPAWTCSDHPRRPGEGPNKPRELEDVRSETRTDDARQQQLIQSFTYRRFEDIFLSQSRRAQVGMLLAATLIAGIWFNRTHALAPLVWEAVVITVTGWRMRYTSDFVRTAPQGGSMRRIGALLAINGVLMAVPLLAFQYFDATDRAAISIILLSSATASTVTTSGHRSLFLAFAAPMLVPLAGAWMFSGGSASPSTGEWGLAALVIVFLLFLVSLGRQVNLVFEESSRYRYGEQQLNAELTLALERADESNRAKTQFLAAASHDLRQPLHAMTVWVGVLRQRDIDEDTRYIVNRLESMNQAMSKQLEGLLDISKLDAGIVTPKRSPCRLDELLAGHQEGMQALADEGGIRLELQCSEALTAVTDDALLARILQNLTDNALKFTRRGGRIGLSLHREDDCAVLRVSDTGIGIAGTEHERVFREFYQVANTERDRSKGLGLGLSIVRRLCGLIDVELQLASEPGVGTTITLRLPLSSVEARPAIATAALDVRGLSVLVIDDEKEVRDSTQALLSNHGCRVHLAASGIEALQIAADAAVDVILSDLRLRDGENGIDVIGRLRKLHPAARAALITADTAPDRLLEAESAGITLMIKPVDPDRFLEAFRPATA